MKFHRQVGGGSLQVYYEFFFRRWMNNFHEPQTPFNWKSNAHTIGNLYTPGSRASQSGKEFHEVIRRDALDMLSEIRREGLVFHRRQMVTLGPFSLKLSFI